VLTVRVEPDEGFVDRSLEAMRALDRGETPDEEYHGVSLRDPHELSRLLSATNVELLRTIAREEPESIRELCRLVDRDIRQVSDNLAELEALGVVELQQNGRAKRPRFEYDEIEIRVPIERDPEREPAPA
jgi:predicted transcriptional regulator